MPENIHFLGLKKQIDLPSYLYYSDYAILPFKTDEIGKYVSPLKLFEYIAMNKPVISTMLDDIIGAIAASASTRIAQVMNEELANEDPSYEKISIFDL
jgi:glycosyltransferase involved in cell wall biosynthesis